MQSPSAPTSLVPVFLPGLVMALTCCATPGLVFASEGAYSIASLGAIGAGLISSALSMIGLAGIRAGKSWGKAMVVAAALVALVIACASLLDAESASEGALRGADAASAAVVRAQAERFRTWHLLGALVGLLPACAGGALGYFSLRARRAPATPAA